jgi:hypothetical protein
MWEITSLLFEIESHNINYASRSIIDDSTVMFQIVASLMIVTYEENMFIVQASPLMLSGVMLIVNMAECRGTKIPIISLGT